ncbi:hypothetical protein [Metabacillus litoralis]|nr:hypothetical protein [Metabacillus litoralis]MCM3160992.1 hypothetical protein [Metabacillus litoralis]
MMLRRYHEQREKERLAKLNKTVEQEEKPVKTTAKKRQQNKAEKKADA